MSEKKQVEIKPEELRKGNLMTVFDKVVLVKAYDIYCLEEGMDSFIMQPIPLTEEWLMKLGSKKQPRGLIYMSLSCLNAEIHFQTYIRKPDANIEIVSTIISQFSELILNRIYYVHQLQNLYFAITGEELIIKVFQQREA